MVLTEAITGQPPTQTEKSDAFQLASQLFQVASLKAKLNEIAEGQPFMGNDDLNVAWDTILFLHHHTNKSAEEIIKSHIKTEPRRKTILLHKETYARRYFASLEEHPVDDPRWEFFAPERRAVVAQVWNDHIMPILETGDINFDALLNEIFPQSEEESAYFHTYLIRSLYARWYHHQTKLLQYNPESFGAWEKRYQEKLAAAGIQNPTDAGAYRIAQQTLAVLRATARADHGGDRSQNYRNHIELAHQHPAPSLQAKTDTGPTCPVQDKREPENTNSSQPPNLHSNSGLTPPDEPPTRDPWTESLPPEPTTLTLDLGEERLEAIWYKVQQILQETSINQDSSKTLDQAIKKLNLKDPDNLLQIRFRHYLAERLITHPSAHGQWGQDFLFKCNELSLDQSQPNAKVFDIAFNTIDSIRNSWWLLHQNELAKIPSPEELEELHHFFSNHGNAIAKFGSQSNFERDSIEPTSHPILNWLQTLKETTPTHTLSVLALPTLLIIPYISFRYQTITSAPDSEQTRALFILGEYIFSAALTALFLAIFTSESESQKSNS